MTHRDRSISLFGMSFLDVLFCALGGAVMLLMHTTNTSREQGEAYRNAAATLRSEIQTQEETISSLRGQAGQLTNDLSSLQSKYDRETARLMGELDKARAEAASRIASLETDVREAQEALTNAKQYSASQLATASRQLGEEKRKATEAVAELQREIGELRQAVSDGHKRHDELQQAMASRTRELEGKVKQAVGEIDRLRGKVGGVIGLRGPMKNVAFVFDTSQSMGQAVRAEERFPIYKELLTAWVSMLDFERFNVVRFFNMVETRDGWEGTLVEASPQNRATACTYIDSFRPAGTTNTMGALQYALGMLPDVDTIILFSDGQPDAADGTPNGGKPAIEWILAYLHEKNRSPTGQPRVTINTVAMGDYLNEDYGEFLRDLAKDNGGVFIGR